MNNRKSRVSKRYLMRRLQLRKNKRKHPRQSCCASEVASPQVGFKRISIASARLRKRKSSIGTTWPHKLQSIDVIQSSRDS